MDQNQNKIQLSTTDVLIIGATVAVVASAIWLSYEAEQVEEDAELVKIQLTRIEDQLVLANERIESGNELLKDSIKVRVGVNKR